MDALLREIVLDRLRQELAGEEEVDRVAKLVESCYDQEFSFEGTDGEKEFLRQRKNIFRINILTDVCLGTSLFFKETSHGKIAETDDVKTMVFRLFNLFDDEKTAFLLPVPNEAMKHYHPSVMVLRACVRFFEKINAPLAKTNPSVSLINDIFETVFRKTAGFCQMLVLGLFPDAFVAWRTLHESECIVQLLVEGGEGIRQAYLKHIAYNNFYRNQAQFTKEELDQAFLEMKTEMKGHGLKSKDMKKFIEYGWLYASPVFDPSDVHFKLNFRDGVEKLSGLQKYSAIYEGASEIAHSSSAFFYVNDAFCRDLSLCMVYETFQRIVGLYLDYMKVYFAMHPEKRAEALLFVEDVSKMSATLMEKVGNLGELYDDEKNDERTL